MDEGRLRELFLARMHMEMQLFKDSMLRKDKADIFAASYRIEVYVNLYEILVEQAEKMSEVLIRELVYRPSGILDALYQEWLNREDAFYTELRECVEDELEVILAEMTAKEGEEDENGEGKRTDKAA